MFDQQSRTEMEVNMKNKILSILKLTLLFVAIFSASCPSQGGYYQPKVPNKLKL